MVENEVIFGGMAAIPIIVPMLQAVKGLVKKVWPNTPTEIWPFAAIALGVSWQVLISVGTENFGRETLLLGVLMGLAASGLYSPLKTALTEVQERLNGDPN